MYDTVKGMLENICHLITKYGFMPNGTRVYFLNRSQPPLFTLMIQSYLKSTIDTNFIGNIIQCVETEMNFWSDNRTIPVEKDGVTHMLAHYQSSSNTPRPEAYAEDVRTCSSYADKAAQSLCYQSLKSGAETGWDFSSRWFFDDNGGVDTNLTHIQAQRVIPVDLNAFLCRAFADLADFYETLGNKEKSDYWQERSDIWKKSIQMVLYDEEEGIWFDYDSQLQKARKYFFPSNYAPLWAEVYDLSKKEVYGRRAAAYFVKQGVDQYLGGIPTSLLQSGEQWDLTNAWPPLQEIVVLGLSKTGNSNATELASTLADRWISANMLGYEENSIMFEKYDAVVPGRFGGGGEYTVQAGFGWTNGVAFSFIDEFYIDS
ncbi:unnamed protein product [Ceutorhynchus assimilis]|uniref:Trehalase n=1 Tax=Ceutorhynchus assimilis TaxID=467358 RepID=A0A9N9N018_9CUCU|nr:unnamed protein product [Ceutorhynchus assimilis]